MYSVVQRETLFSQFAVLDVNNCLRLLNGKVSEQKLIGKMMLEHH